MNKRKIVAVVMSLILGIVFLAGCGSKVSVKDDLTNYDKEASKVIQKMKSSDPTKMDDFKTTLKDMKKQLEGIDIKTSDVKDLNKLFLKGLNEFIGAYEDVAKATKTNDQKLATKATSEAEKAQKDLENFTKKADALAKEKGVTLKMKSIS